MTRLEISQRIDQVRDLHHSPADAKLILAGFLWMLLGLGGLGRIQEEPRFAGAFKHPEPIVIGLFLTAGPFIVSFVLGQRRMRRRMREHPGPVCPHCGLDFLRPGCSPTVKALGACPRCEKAVVSDPITENDAGPRAPEYGPLISLDDIGQRTREHLRRGRWWRWPALAAFIALYMGALYLGVSYHVIPHTWTGIIAFAAIGGASPFISLGDRIRARDGLCCPRCKRAWDTEVLRTSNCARCGLQIIDRKSYFKER